MELDPRLGAVGDRASSLTSLGPDGASRPSPIHYVPSASASLMPLPAPHDAHDDHNDAVNTPGASTEHRDTPQYQNQQLQDADHDGDGSDPRRPRACEACRGLKVRCEPDPNEEGPCKRCRKAGRNCVVTMPTRKRQKKTDSRVAELEKKIDALTASLQARAPAGGQAHSHAQSQAHGVDDSPGSVAPKLLSESNTPASSYNHSIKWGKHTQPPTWGSFSTTHSPMPPMSTVDHNPDRASPARSTTTMTPATVTGQKRKFSEGREGSAEQPNAEETPAEALAAYLTRAKGGDIVDRGVITMEKATELFARYNDHMISHLPAVIFQPGFTASELRKAKPILFLAIMAVASAESPILQKVLQKEMKLTFAEKVMLSGDKSLELVQALNVAVIWYWPPEHFEELKFYQLVHTSAVMAIDIGLGQKLKQRRGLIMPDTLRSGSTNSALAPPSQNRRWAPPDPTSIESRRTWLTCYFLAANTSMALHRPNLIRWTPFMDESLHLLRSSPNAAPSDAYFCHLVWTHHLSEEVGVQFALDDPTAEISMADTRTRYVLKNLERDLRQYKEKIPADLLQPTLLISFGVLNLYMHEVALQSRAAEPLRQPYSAAALQEGLVGGDKLSPAHISAVATCLDSIKDILNTFLTMDVFSVRCLPVFNFVRVAYAVVMLIKLYFSAASSDLGQVVDKEDMEVGKYLDGLLDKFRATAADDRCRPAAKFLVVLVMLRSWFYRQAESEMKEAKSAPQSSSINQSPSQQPQLKAVKQSPSQPSDRTSTANTPLQLLSEVATGAGSRNRESSVNRPPVVGWNANMSHAPQPFFHETPENTSSSTSSMPYYNEPFSADLAAAMAPVMPTLPPVTDGMGGYNSGDVHDFVNLIPGWDLEGLGMGMGSQGMWEDGMRIFLEEPWFNTMFQGNSAAGNNTMNF
ncbi:cercosporin resistance [Fusarium heterosporum]|uniref:Cercosporin resistance n=1 Tax=Fusarium heterosporum TaxID=42747 RepID=A0A8H5WI82_FUSHE|nr:cercosporin resistance [Fusarium heterosporum]